jgi:hypothetical protein
MTILNGLQKVIGGIVDSFNDVGISFSVGSPENNDPVKTIGRLEIAVRWLNQVLDGE